MTNAPHPPSFLASKLGGLPRPFWALWSGTLVNRLGTMVVPFTGVYLTTERDFSVATAGLAMAVFGAGSLASQLLAGELADRIGRRKTLSGSMLATAITLMLLGYSTSLPAILGGMFVLGLLIDAYRPASNALVADLVSPTQRPRAYGLLFWAINLGYAISMTAGGWLASAGYHWLFWIDAVSCLGFALLVWRAVPETTPEPSKGATGGFSVVLKDKVMMAFIVVILGNALVYAQTFTMLPVAMTSVVGLSTQEFGMTVALNGLLIVAVQPLVSGWIGRFDLSRTMALGLVIIAVGFGLTAFVTNMALLGGTIVVWTLGEIILAGSAGTIIAGLAPAHLRGRYSGMFGFAWSVATMVAPLLGSVLLNIGFKTLWLSIGAIGLASAAGMLMLAPAIRKRTSQPADLGPDKLAVAAA